MSTSGGKCQYKGSSSPVPVNYFIMIPILLALSYPATLLICLSFADFEPPLLIVAAFCFLLNAF